MPKLTEDQATQTLRFVSHKPWRLLSSEGSHVYVRMYVESPSGGLYQVIGGTPPAREDDLGLVYVLRSDGESIDACPSLFGLRWEREDGVPKQVNCG